MLLGSLLLPQFYYTYAMEEFSFIAPVGYEKNIKESRKRAYDQLSEEKTVDGIQRFFCKICSKGFERNKSLVGHIVAAHSEYLPRRELPCKPNVPSVDIQSTEGFSFILPAGYEKNIKESRQRASNQLYERKAIDGIQRFVCKICSIDFASNQSIALHVTHSHSELMPKKEFACKECKTEFVDLKNLSDHQLLKNHEGVIIVNTMESNTPSPEARSHTPEKAPLPTCSAHKSMFSLKNNFLAMPLNALPLCAECKEEYKWSYPDRCTQHTQSIIKKLRTITRIPGQAQAPNALNVIKHNAAILAQSSRSTLTSTSSSNSLNIQETPPFEFPLSPFCSQEYSPALPEKAELLDMLTRSGNTVLNGSWEKLAVEEKLEEEWDPGY